MSLVLLFDHQKLIWFVFRRQLVGCKDDVSNVNRLSGEKEEFWKKC